MIRVGRFFDWLIGEPQARDTAPPSDPSTARTYPTRASSERAVSSRDAMSLSMVYRAIQIHATAVGSLSLDAYRGAQIMEPSPAFIRQPDLDDTRPAFLEMTTVSLASRGNAYWKITRDSSSRVSNLQVLNPLDVVIKTSNKGRVLGYDYQGQELAVKDVKHLRLLRVPGTPYGLGPIQAAQAELRGAIDLRDYAAHWFQESGVPSGILKTDQHLTPERADEAREMWDNVPAGKTRVLGSGLEYKSVLLSPKDAQFLESQSFSVTQMARLFGVPASLMLAAVEGNSQSYANVAQDWLAYYRFTLSKYTREIETALSDLLPRGQEARFNYEALLRADTETRYKAHAIALASGFMTVNEVRAIENLPALPGADQPAPTAPATETTDA